MTHPKETVLALYAGRELGLWWRFQVRRHVNGCERCARHLEELRAVREFLAGQPDDLPENVHWDALASEMKANIRVGLAAGQCVTGTESEPLRVPWRTPALALPVLLVVIVGWILQSVPPTVRPAAGPGPAAGAQVLEASQSGIGIEENGRGFRLLHPRAEDVMYSVRGDAVRSRYVDGDTGQVTISHVYAE